MSHLPWEWRPNIMGSNPFSNHSSYEWCATPECHQSAYAPECHQIAVDHHMGACTHLHMSNWSIRWASIHPMNDALHHIASINTIVLWWPCYDHTDLWIFDEFDGPMATATRHPLFVQIIDAILFCILFCSSLVITVPAAAVTLKLFNKILCKNWHHLVL